MTSRKSVAKKLKKKNLPQIEADVYSKIPANNLVVYVIYFLEEKGITPTVEDIVSTCFRLFPHSFSLKNYPRWPDSALVIRRINDVRAKGLVKGDAAEGYAVKYKGKLLAIRIAKALGLIKPEPRKINKKTAPAKIKATVKPTKAKVSKSRVAKVTKPKTIKKAQTAKTSKSTSVSPSKKKSPKKQVVKPVVVAKKEVKAAKPQKKIKKPTPTPVEKVEKKKPVQKTAKAEKPVQLKLALAPAKAEGAKPAAKKPKTKPKASPKQPNKSIRKKAKDEKKSAVKQRPIIEKVVTKPTKAKKKSSPKTKTQKKQVITVKQQPKVEKKAAPKPKVQKKQVVAVKKQPKEIQKTVPTPSIQFTKEEKAKAIKVIRMVEKSSAYKIYKKNGGKSKIGEFDFRDMLLSTMESSAETLKRNVEMFKRYANIENRPDLVSFLVYCEGNFKTLLTPQAKKKR